jgi:hypothetical protein
MKISKKFKQLTEFTYPHGTEGGLIKYLPNGYKEDGLGNYYLQIGDKPSTMFTCHLDTACSYSKKVNHIRDGNFIKTDETTILGADDKAGMTVMLYMIDKGITGLYYFFIGEEAGCVGSGRLSSKWSEYDFSNYIKKVVSFDRRGTDSVITKQLFRNCCSIEFAKELSNQLNLANSEFKFSPDPTGIYTDSVKFMDLVPECTNISVGYYNEHFTNEKQDIVFLRKLCDAVCRVNWEDLPIQRNHLISDNSDEYTDDYDYDDGEYIYDDDYDFDDWREENYSFFKINGKIEKLHILKSHINKEKTLIYNWLVNSNIYPGLISIRWNGNSLYVESDMLEYVGDRIDIIDLVPDLGTVPMSVLKKLD